MKKIDWRYGWYWGADLESCYRSIWLGWWLVTWYGEGPWSTCLRSIHVSFQPGP